MSNLSEILYGIKVNTRVNENGEKGVFLEDLNSKEKFTFWILSGTFPKGVGELKSYDFFINTSEFPNGIVSHFAGLSPDEKYEFISSFAEEIDAMNKAIADGKVEPWSDANLPTYDPNDPNLLEKIQEEIENGEPCGPNCECFTQKE